MNKEKIIYISPALSAFVKKDIAFLNNSYTVISPNLYWQVKTLIPLAFIEQFFFLIINGLRVKAIFVMFGGYWSFLPALIGKLYNKPVYIILAGTDCASFPSINYGSLRKPLLRQFIKWSYMLATRLLPVDDSLVISNYSYFEGDKYKKQGYKFYFPNINTPYTVIYFGFDSKLFTADLNEKAPNTFVTVAHVTNMASFKRKGIDILIKLADSLPNCEFTVIGVLKKIQEGLNNLPSNIKFYEFLPQEDFIKYLKRSEFYVQLSIMEGFPNALCEGMLCKTIPIVSNVAAMPKIIADTGIVVEKSDFNHVFERFKLALALDKNTKENLANKARNRVIENYSMQTREKLFIEVIENKS